MAQICDTYQSHNILGEIVSQTPYRTRRKPVSVITLPNVQLTFLLRHLTGHSNLIQPITNKLAFSLSSLSSLSYWRSISSCAKWEVWTKDLNKGPSSSKAIICWASLSSLLMALQFSRTLKSLIFFLLCSLRIVHIFFLSHQIKQAEHCCKLL